MERRLDKAAQRPPVGEDGSRSGAMRWHRIGRAIVQHVEEISLEEAERVLTKHGLPLPDGRGTCRYADGTVRLNSPVAPVAQTP